MADAATVRSALAAHPWRVVLGVLALAIVVLVLLWDWNWFKGLVERQVEARTGRSFDIGGDLDVDVDWTPTITLDDIRFGNAKWSKEPTMASAERLQLSVELKPLLLRREVRLKELRLRKPDLLLEMGPGRVGNWVFGEQRENRTVYRTLWIDDGHVRFVDAAQKTGVDLAVASRAVKGAAGTEPPPLDAEGTGRWRGNPFTLRGTADSPLHLRDKLRPYRIDVRAAAGATRAHARGTVTDPFRLRDPDLKVALSGQDLADMYALFGVVLPNTPPYRLDGRLLREGATWNYHDFAGVVGDSDLAGDAEVDTGRERLFLRANLVSRRLDFDDLAGFVNAPPQTGGKETANPEQKRQAAQLAARPRILPDRPYELHKLRAMDADVRWKARRINTRKLPLDDMDAHMVLDHGVLRLEPLNFGVAGGDIRSNIRMDAREDTIRTRADIDVRGLDIARLMPEVEAAKDAIGRIGGDITLAGSGNSIARMLGTADGQASVGMGRGQISNLVMELAGIDIAESLKFLVRGDQRIPIRCAFGDFAVKDGVMTTRALAFDTTDTIIVGQGNVSLREETLDLKLRPRPKDRSLLSLRVPLLVQGTFKDPSFRPDPARLGLRAAIALTLANIAPPAALLATLELGPGKDSGCGGRYAD